MVALLEDCVVTNNDRHLEFYQELADLVKTARTGTFCASMRNNSLHDFSHKI